MMQFLLKSMQFAWFKFFSKHLIFTIIKKRLTSKTCLDCFRLDLKKKRLKKNISFVDVKLTNELFFDKLKISPQKLTLISQIF